MTSALQYKPRASLTPKKLSLTDKAYSAIKAEINAGHIPLNSFINIPEIEQQLAMSRTPVREAMLRLQTEKVVEIVPKRGIHILPLSVTDLIEYYQVIAGLEVEAVGNICRRRLTRTDIMPFLYALSSMENALKGDDHDAWALAEETFHRSLFILNGNHRLTETGLSYRDIVQRAHLVALRHIPISDKKRFLRHHNSLKELILSANEKLARENFQEQCDWASGLTAQILAEQEIISL
ncbi:GntR family transcriptional regulator [Sneathiella sp.]|uniref:GntR family transcriptional regulator n=1 Tax=Sneathiella sp. TaxID=1964365 RepID=UPI003562FE79